MTPINKQIIYERTNKSLPDYFDHLKEYIEEHVDKKHILLGLGEVLDEPQKDWAKDHLLDELLFQIKLRKEAEDNLLS